MNFNQALVKNILNSPFSSHESDGTEIGLTENYLYYIRQLHAPVADSKISALASLFSNTISLEDKPEFPRERKIHILRRYEQYFARVELFNAIVNFEATIRQLIKGHLETHSEIKKKIDTFCPELLTERGNIIQSCVCLLNRIIENEPDFYLKPKILQYISDLKNYFLDPLVSIRNGIAHGIIRAYIDVKKNILVDEKHSNARAKEIYNNIDAVTYHILSQNFNYLHHISYHWLLGYKDNIHSFSKFLEKDISEQLFFYKNEIIWKDPKKFLKLHSLKVEGSYMQKACYMPYAGFEKLLKFKEGKMR